MVDDQGDLGLRRTGDEDWRRVMAVVASEKLRPVVDGVTPLADGRAAYERLERGEQFGKLVLGIDV